MVFVVPHTHWDREWYLTFESFRFLLGEAVERVLYLLRSQKTFRFVLDGQVIPLLDYLEVFPEKRNEIEFYVRDGRLKIGPWYVQPDEFLVSGEALIRNLLLGIKLAEEFGSSMRIGYVPDAFGHLAQLPQIFKGFGIDTVFLMRGADEACETAGGSEFSWVGPDGSVVNVHVFEKGYDAARRLEEVTKELLENLASRAKTGIALLPLGGDHIAPQRNFPEALMKAEAVFSDYCIQIGTFEDYAACLRLISKNLPVVKGELRASKWHFILSGVFSTRIYLKQANFRVQNLLERYAEPLAAASWQFRGVDLRPWLRQAWLTLLQNHAHDSICGTCIDPVHREMLVRFEKAETLGNHVFHKAMEELGQSKEEKPCVVVFNPCPWQRYDEVEVLVPSGLAGAILQDQDGNELQTEHGEPTLVSKAVLEGVKHEKWVALKFWDELPPLGFKVYFLKTGKSTVQKRCGVKVGENFLENKYYQVVVAEDGTFSLVDKETGQEFSHLHILVDEGDAGDEYNFSPPKYQTKIFSRNIKGKIKLCRSLPWKGSLQIESALNVPRGLSSDRSRRAEEFIELPFIVTFSLQKDMKRVDISLEVENRAQDHRLRAAFPTQIKTDHVWAEDSFWIAHRSLRDEKKADWVELPSKTHPQKGFVAVEDGKRGFALLSRGLPEHEVDEEGTVYLTLLRCVGWLSRDDLSTRRGHAGPPYPTPEAQCLGRHRFEYAIFTYRGSWINTNLLRVAQEFFLPPRGFFAESHWKGPHFLLALDPPTLMLSAFKPANEGAGIIVRIYNPTSETLVGNIVFGWPVNEVWEATLDESFIRKLSKHPTAKLSLVFNAGEIKTLRVI